MVHSAISTTFQPLLKLGFIPQFSSSFLATDRTISWLQNRGSSSNVYQPTISYTRCSRWSSTVVRSSASQECHERRSAHYHPTIWDHQFIQTLKNPCTNELSYARLKELKKEVKLLIQSTNQDPLLQLKLIDLIQRLGVAYHFEEKIRESLSLHHLGYWEGIDDDDLYSAALKFRLLRQHGYQISSDVFNAFKNKTEHFKNWLSDETEGLLSLYEAAHLGVNGETLLEDAMEFSVSSLKSLLMEKSGSNHTKRVRQSLEVPLQWRMVRLEARNSINAYEKDINVKKSWSVLLELAKLDFNIVQLVHQKELQELSRWWRELALEKELCFARDRLVENFMWAVGIIYEPEFSKCRIELTKLISILTVVDDIYDVYGSLDELELFTNAIERWDIKNTEDLPNYMKLCYSALLNFGNEIVYDAQKDLGLNILPYITKEWARLCRAYLVEARWFYKGYTPGLEEYLGNAWITVGGPVAMVHACILQLECRSIPPADETLDCLIHGSSDLFYWASIITRLTDDLGTSQAEMERGDVSKSIQCYMKEKGVSEGEARQHIEGLVRDSWKKLNECAQSCGLPRWVVDMALNMARTSQCIFQHGDGIGTSAELPKIECFRCSLSPFFDSHD